MNKQLLKFKNVVRSFSYKPVKRPDISKTTTFMPPVVNATGDSLAQRLQTKIKATGPITVAEYMKEVLSNPITGYYMSRDVFGEHGDFITSPEIGQVFGELVAVWCLSEWRKIGRPSPFQLVELGPGRGTLLKDILRVFSRFETQRHFSIHLVEISPYLSKLQGQLLCSSYTAVESQDSAFYQKGETVSGIQVYWYQRLEDIPNEFSVVLAHEFFDALPIHKLEKIDEVWKEILIDVDAEKENQFKFVMSRAQTPISQFYNSIENDTRNSLEYSIETHNIIQKLGNRFESDGGFSLIMDYGHFGDKTDTFRAFKNHKLHDPLLNPGTADLTADVDFKQIKLTAERTKKLLTFGPVEQGAFLKRMGGDTRIQMLLDNATPENKDSIISGYDMLTNSNQMGSRFKFFALFPLVLEHHLSKFPVAGFSDVVDNK